MTIGKWKIKSKTGHYGPAVCQELHFPFIIFHLPFSVGHFDSGTGLEALELRSLSAMRPRSLLQRVCRCHNESLSFLRLPVVVMYQILSLRGRSESFLLRTQAEIPMLLPRRIGAESVDEAPIPRCGRQAPFAE